MNSWLKHFTAIFTFWSALAAGPVQGQNEELPQPSEYQMLSDQQLDQLLGPIALYPDPLIAQILPASTLPSQIVLADRYVSGGGDPNLIDQQPWDAGVRALARYPSVLKWMDDNLNWTTAVGQAFANQQQAVMDSVQRLRATAQNLHNLQSTPQQQVVDNDGSIEILPTNPEVIYVPQYVPDNVYYQTGIGPPFITFGIGFAIGGWLNCDFDWHHHHIIEWDHHHPRPPNWWHERPDRRNIIISRQPNVWRPENHREFGTAIGGDRGWERRPSNRPGSQPIITPSPHPSERPGFPSEVHPGPRPGDHPGNPAIPQPHPAPPREALPRPTPVIPSGPVPIPRAQVPNRTVPSGPFIGIESPRETRNFSGRGQQSMGIAPRPAPVAPPPPAFRSAPINRSPEPGQPLKR